MFKEGSPQTEQEKVSRPNLLDDFEGCVETILKVEGSVTSLSERQKWAIIDGMRGARTVLLEQLAEMEPERKRRYEDINRENAYRNIVTGFQGVDGFNRYRVLGNGEIAISESHAIVDCEKIFREYGIIPVLS